MGFERADQRLMSHPESTARHQTISAKPQQESPCVSGKGRHGAARPRGRRHAPSPCLSSVKSPGEPGDIARLQGRTQERDPGRDRGTMAPVLGCDSRYQALAPDPFVQCDSAASLSDAFALTSVPPWTSDQVVSARRLRLFSTKQAPVSQPMPSP